ncbi:conserved exported protein of unknown function [Modestobacter italicus]|uniref:Uncharacterized protein n=1 Tax=Modestobacter italicus (strain DSM 44449 / CECT 9708 / BC 501) TaxID=2732864 RepID=I4EUJ9_MODI5|nr:hypothetical protein [Modestobacter marinus]CCH87062.1 conserved exported protein of unknown function [Modestobacter marinus]
MNSTAAKVGAYVVGLAVAFAAAFGIGSAVGPVGPTAGQTESPAPASDAGHDGMDMNGGTGS